MTKERKPVKSGSLGRILLWSNFFFFLLCRFPFIACEVFTCEIDVILKTLVEEEEVRSSYYAI